MLNFQATVIVLECRVSEELLCRSGLAGSWQLVASGVWSGFVAIATSIFALCTINKATNERTITLFVSALFTGVLSLAAIVCQCNAMWMLGKIEPDVAKYIYFNRLILGNGEINLDLKSDAGQQSILNMAILVVILFEFPCILILLIISGQGCCCGYVIISTMFRCMITSLKLCDCCSLQPFVET
jgi:hypothetical protein